MTTWLLSLLLAAAPCETTAFCRCVPITPEAAAERADAIFTATVVSVRNFPPAEPGGRSPGHEARLRVHAAWKGVESPEVVIQSRGTTCDFVFRPGDRYLIYGRMDSAGVFHAGYCMGSRRVEPGAETVEALGPPPRTWPAADAAAR